MDTNFRQQLEEAKKTFGYRLRKLRESFDYTGTELGKKLGSELNAESKALISRWENGHELPNGRQLFGLHKIFDDVSLDYLFGITSHSPLQESEQSNGKTSLPIHLDPLFKYLWSEAKTEQVETSASVVWVATHNFFWNYESTKWSELLFENITKRKIKNYYLYQKTPENDKTVKYLTDNFQRIMHDEWHDFVHFVASPSDEFPGWAEYVLYDYKGENPRCIMVLPHGYGERDIGGYNLEFTLPMKDAFATWFQTLWNKNIDRHDTAWIIS